MIMLYIKNAQSANNLIENKTFCLYEDVRRNFVHKNRAVDLLNEILPSFKFLYRVFTRYGKSRQLNVLGREVGKY